jgi:signal transduction histidine kinase
VTIAPLAVLSLTVNGIAVAIAIAMILLVLWQAPRHGENRLLATYFLAFGWSSVLLFTARVAHLLGRDPSRMIVEAFAGSAVAATAFFTLSVYVTDLWRRPRIRAACAILFFLGAIAIRPGLVAGAMVTFGGYAPDGTAEVRFLLAGWLAFASFVVLFLAGLASLWLSRDGHAGRLLPGAVIAVGGFLAGFLVPWLRPFSVPVLASVLGATLWTRAILRDRLFDPLAVLNESLREANALAEDRNRHLEAEIAAREALIAELDAFAHTVAHDLRNPLAPIIAAAEELSSPVDGGVPADDERAELLAMVLRNGRRMARIIDELLLLARVRRGAVQPQPLDMAAIVADAIDATCAFVVPSGAVIVTPEAWPIAIGHPQWVAEVWANYVSNAVKYGGPRPRVVLGWSRTDAGVRFWVRDDGPGVAAEQKAHLFRPFTRLDEVTATGEGLGLSIVQRIVARLGGEVGVVSPTESGRGCEFWFTLPAPESGTRREDVPSGDAAGTRATLST